MRALDHLVFLRIPPEIRLGTFCVAADPGGGTWSGGSRPWDPRASPPGVREHPLRRPGRAVARPEAGIVSSENGPKVMTQFAGFRTVRIPGTAATAPGSPSRVSSNAESL